MSGVKKFTLGTMLFALVLLGAQMVASGADLTGSFIQPLASKSLPFVEKELRVIGNGETYAVWGNLRFNAIENRRTGNTSWVVLADIWNRSVEDGGNSNITVYLDFFDASMNPLPTPYGERIRLIDWHNFCGLRRDHRFEDVIRLPYNEFVQMAAFAKLTQSEVGGRHKHC